MLYIAIGRNVGESPMPEDRWVMFRESVEDIVLMGEGLKYPDTRAVGESNFEGMPEETAVFVWFDKSDDLREITVQALGELSRKFGQESIAWTVAGETRFTEGV
jgi:hypothetical protein